MAENYISTVDEKGSVNISEEVIAVMVAAAISEVEGVAGLATTGGGELSDFVGKRNISKGIRVQFAQDLVSVEASVIVKYGSSITAIAERTQKGVAAAIESMTGLGTPQVHIHVSGVAFDKK